MDREVSDHRGGAAEGAIRITLQPDFPKSHLQRIVGEETAHERVTDIQKKLDGLSGLNRADCAWEHAQDARLASGGDQPRWRWGGIKAAVARAPVRVKDRDHSFELKDRAVDIRLFQEITGVIDQIAGVEVVRAIHHQIVVPQDLDDILHRQTEGVRDDLHVRVQGLKGLPRGVHLGPTHVLGLVENLALEVRELDMVRINDSKGPDPGGGEIECRGGAEPSGPDAEDLRQEKSLLPPLPHLGEHEVAAVSLDLLGCQGGLLDEGIVQHLPTLKPTDQGGDVFVTELLERLGREERAEAREAIEDERGLRIRNGLGNLEFQESPTDGDRRRDQPLPAPLVGVPDVNQQEFFAGLELFLEVLAGDLRNDLASLCQQLAVRLCHARIIPHIPIKCYTADAPVRVGIDARLLGDFRSGIGRYTSYLVEELGALPGPEEYTLFLDGPPRGQVGNPRLTPYVIENRHRLLWSFHSLPLKLRRLQLDCFHSVTGYELPFVKRSAFVSTVHDLIPLRFPALTPWRYRMAFRLLIRRAIRVADRIIAVSESTRRDLIELLHAPVERIRVIHEAVDDRFRPLGNQEILAALRLRYSLPHRFLLFVGLLEPKKNLSGLLQAIACLRRAGRWPSDLRLVVVGDQGWAVGNLPQLVGVLGLEGIVRFLGYVPDSDLPSLYGAAEAFVFPSLYEGFGLPVVEAMACGTPVVASNRGSLPEVAGDAALLLEPDEPEGLAEGIYQVITDPALREEYRQRGLQRARAFSWRRAAEATLTVYHEAARKAR